MKELSAIGWARVSTPKQWKDGDCMVQETKVRKWCKENGIRYIASYSSMYNKHETPFGVKKSPHMNQLLVEIDTLAQMGQQPNMVVAISIDRYGNEDIILNILLPFYEGRLVAMVAIQENVDSSRDRDAFIQAVYDAEITEKDIVRAEKTQKDRKEKYRLKRESGIMKASPIYGYDYDSKLQEYKKDEFMAGIVELIFIMYVFYHHTLDEICIRLTDEKVKPLRAKDRFWSQSI